MIINIEDFWNWYNCELEKYSDIKIDILSLDNLENWNYKDSIYHQSNKFFSVIGTQIVDRFTNNILWDQPLIDQPEVGILGIISTLINNTRYFLMQLKFEPGNINVLQLSPTIQATWSNYNQIHGGTSVLYLKYFLNPDNILYDRLQTEQGGRFYQKQNRNIIIEMESYPQLEKGYNWISEDLIRVLLRKNNIINMNTRSVLSGLLTYKRKICCDLNEVLNWISFIKTETYSNIIIKKIALHALTEWNSEASITHLIDDRFSIIGLGITGGNREVNNWQQPIIQDENIGLIGFICAKKNDQYYYLVKAKFEPGNIGMNYLSPTVQCSSYQINHDIFLNKFTDPKANIKYDTILSEEGGRFYKYCNRYIIVEIDDMEEIAHDKNYKWMQYDQLLETMNFGLNNVECRTLLFAHHF